MPRTYKINLEKSRGISSPEQIRISKNSRTRARNDARNAQLRQEAEDRNKEFNLLSPAEKWEYLDLKLGRNRGAVKQRIKLAEVLKKEYTPPDYYKK